MRHGRAALEHRPAHGYHRAAVRTWFVLRPIAQLRDDAPLLREMGDWMAASDGPARLAVRADDACRRRPRGRGASGEATDPPDPPGCVTPGSLGYGDPSFIAARDGVLQAWWDAGWFDAVAEALARVTRWGGARPPGVRGPAAVAGADGT